jgi:aspartyl-tRNA(Asn)/glutamyl-tRNA(Gln) amidotransferase subunit C
MFSFHSPQLFRSHPRAMSDLFDVRYVAQLARLELSDAEIAKFQSQLGQVLSHVEKLNKVDVSGVDPTAHANEVVNVFRADEPRDWFTAADALANAPRSANGLFIVPKVIE